MSYDVIIKRRIIPIRLLRNSFQGEGGPGSDVCFLFFLALNLFYSLQRGSNGFIT